MAAACVVFAVGEAVFAHIVTQQHSSFGLADDPTFHYSTKMAGLISSCVGYLLATIGFWLASRNVKTPTPTTDVAAPVA
jgi:hypothetical protein